MKLKVVSFLLLLFASGKTFSQNNEDAFLKKSFIIIFSSKDFEKAVSFATSSAKKLNLKFDKERVQQDSTIHLSFSKTVCNGSGGFGYPCYVARGRYDNGIYISIEYSDAYNGFSKGYYLVIAGSAETGNAELKKDFNKIKKDFPKSYIKNSDVYIGCIH